MTIQATGQSAASSISRRTILKRGGTLAGAAGLLAGGSLTASAGSADSFQLDVAMHGGTMAINRTAGSDPETTFVRGDSFFVKGRIYPGGTIASGLSGPGQGGSIGTWICRGVFLLSFEEIADGATPHVLTTQYFLLDSGDGLITEGTEGGIYTLRAVVGGYGKYVAARGQSGEREAEFNQTMRDSGGGVLVPAPNINFDFALQTS